MNRMGGWIVDSVLAAVGGVVATTLLAVGLLQATLGMHLQSLDMWICDRSVPWWIARHAGIGVQWINGRQNLAPLLGETPHWSLESQDPSPDGQPPPTWAMARLPPLAGLPIDSRFAALGIGWPLPAFIRTWVVLDPDETFPIPAEIDLGSFAVEESIMRLSKNGMEHVQIDVGGLVVDAMVWGFASLTGLRWIRWRRLSRRAAAAAPPAPAA